MTTRPRRHVLGYFANTRFDIRHWWLDPWATTEWPQTLVTPLFVGGPADGKRGEPIVRCKLPLQINIPVLAGAAIAGDINASCFGSVTYKLGPYVDAFTVEYR